uniref:Hydrophobic seed protein domain-containing protein n=1 Tax=Aegilops tauschii subsp. strangulata TaxID=200361 RepID=A0A453D935_AEGTS
RCRRQSHPGRRRCRRQSHPSRRRRRPYRRRCCRQGHPGRRRHGPYRWRCRRQSHAGRRRRRPCRRWRGLSCRRHRRRRGWRRPRRRGSCHSRHRRRDSHHRRLPVPQEPPRRTQGVPSLTPDPHPDSPDAHPGADSPDAHAEPHALIRHVPDRHAEAGRVPGPARQRALHIGDASVKCCPLVQGIAGLTAAACLCTAIKAKVLNLALYVPLALQLLVNDCGCAVPPGYTCA